MTNKSHDEELRKLLKEVTKGLTPGAFKDKEYHIGTKTFIRAWGRLPYEKAICKTGYQCYASYKYPGGWHGSLSECDKCGRVFVLTDNGWEVSNFRQRHAAGWQLFTSMLMGVIFVSIMYTVFGLWWF